ncbi:hypothetical protein [Streptomyces sp. NPDC058426]|uniref:ApeA N-terminal domain 1-containing protein n=1 Tax=Streptomyces sp. NPDC058426 TaxID=3346493 RepID=UPI003663BE66
MPKRRNFEFGEAVTGMLVDGVEDTPYVAASLHLDPESGARIEVPYIDIPGTSQFEATTEWFHSRRPPKNLLLTSLDGDVSLFDCHYAGHTVNYPRNIGVGKLRPTYVVLHRRDEDLNTPLQVREVKSQIDGLIEWTGFTSIKRRNESNDARLIKKVIYEVANSNHVTWRQNSATMTLKSDWLINPNTYSITLNDGVSLTSSYDEPQSIDVHLTEHRKVAALLSFIFGCAIYFRSHELRDPAFTNKTLSGRVIEQPFFQFLSRNTVREHGRPKPRPGSLRHPLASLERLNQNGLEEWSYRYDDWSRFIHPAVSALNRPGAILENLVVNAAMSMEAAGNLIGEVAEESPTLRSNGKPTTATYMYRCLIRTGWDWSEIGASPVGLARAIANNYNTIKHFDRGHFPDPVETHLVSSLTALVVRMLALRIAQPSLNAANLFGAHVHDFDRLKESFESAGVAVDEGGAFTPSRQANMPPSS